MIKMLSVLLLVKYIYYLNTKICIGNSGKNTVHQNVNIILRLGPHGYCHLLFYILQIHYIILMQDKKTCPLRKHEKHSYLLPPLGDHNGQNPGLTQDLTLRCSQQKHGGIHTWVVKAAAWQWPAAPPHPLEASAPGVLGGVNQKSAQSSASAPQEWPYLLHCHVLPWGRSRISPPALLKAPGPSWQLFWKQFPVSGGHLPRRGYWFCRGMRCWPCQPSPHGNCSRVWGPVPQPALRVSQGLRKSQPGRCSPNATSGGPW